MFSVFGCQLGEIKLCVEAETWPFHACAVKNTQYNLYLGGIAEIPASCKKSGSMNTMVTSNVRPGVEIWPFRACAVNRQYNPCYRNILVVVQLL